MSRKVRCLLTWLEIPHTSAISVTTLLICDYFFNLECLHFNETKSYIFMSPEPVINFLSSKNRQDDKNPSYPKSSLVIFAEPVESRLFTSYTVHILSIPPQATKFPVGANATDITHADRNGITWTLLPVQESHIISFPSSDPVTQCLWVTKISGLKISTNRRFVILNALLVA